MLLWMRYVNIPHYNKKVYFVVIACDVGLTWVTFCAVIQAVKFNNFQIISNSFIKFLVIDGNGGIGIFYMFVGLPFTSIAFMKLLDLRAWKIMRSNYKNFKRDEEVFNKIINFIYCVLKSWNII